LELRRPGNCEQNRRFTIDSLNTSQLHSRYPFHLQSLTVDPSFLWTTFAMSLRHLATLVSIFTQHHGILGCSFLICSPETTNNYHQSHTTMSLSFISNRPSQESSRHVLSSLNGRCRKSSPSPVRKQFETQKTPRENNQKKNYLRRERALYAPLPPLLLVFLRTIFFELFGVYDGFRDDGMMGGRSPYLLWCARCALHTLLITLFLLSLPLVRRGREKWEILCGL